MLTGNVGYFLSSIVCIIWRYYSLHSFLSWRNNSTDMFFIKLIDAWIPFFVLTDIEHVALTSIVHCHRYSFGARQPQAMFTGGGGGGSCDRGLAGRTEDTVPSGGPIPDPHFNLRHSLGRVRVRGQTWTLAARRTHAVREGRSCYGELYDLLRVATKLRQM